MLRTTKSFTVDDVTYFKENLLLWAQQFDTAIWLDSNKYQQQYSSFDCALAAEEFTSIITDYSNAFDKLKEYQSTTKDYIFGFRRK